MAFKKLFLNNNYLFDCNGNYYLNGLLHKYKENEDLLNLEIDNKYFTFSKKWLGLLAHFEVDIPLDEVLKINFVDCDSKVMNLKCKSIMVFKKPILFADGFRLIPGFPRFMINELGDVISIKTNHLLSQKIGPYGYPYVNVYDPDKNKWRSVNLHILLARSFVKNNDPCNKFFVNHKDGNKLNYKLKNLEWVTSQQNNNHAVFNSFRKDNFDCRVSDIVTGKITKHSSISNALISIGFSKGCKEINKNINGAIRPILFKNRFEIKLLSDESKWFYNLKNYKTKKFLVGPYQALDVQTLQVFESNSIPELSRLVNVTIDKISLALKRPTIKIIGNFIFRIKSTQPWNITSEKVKSTPPIKINAFSISTNEILKFKSKSETINYFKIDKRTLNNRLQFQKPYNNWIFTKET